MALIQNIKIYLNSDLYAPQFLYKRYAFTNATTMAGPMLGMFRKAWKRTMLIDIGTSITRAKGTHFFRTSNNPTTTSVSPTNPRIYPFPDSSDHE